MVLPAGNDSNGFSNSGCIQWWTWWEQWSRWSTILNRFVISKWSCLELSHRYGVHEHSWIPKLLWKSQIWISIVVQRLPVIIKLWSCLKWISVYFGFYSPKRASVLIEPWWFKPVQCIPPEHATCPNIHWTLETIQCPHVTCCVTQGRIKMLPEYRERKILLWSVINRWISCNSQIISFNLPS